MDWLQFISTIVGHLAWPAVAVIMAVALRKHLGSMADRLIELSIGGAKITLEKKLLEGAEIIEQSPGPEPKPADQPQLPLEKDAPPKQPEGSSRTIARSKRTGRFKTVRNLMITGAVADIIANYERVNSILFDIGDAIGIDAAQPSSVLYAISSRGMVEKEAVALYESIRDVRNLVAHGRALPDAGEALEYTRQAAYLQGVLERVKFDIDTGGEKPPPKQG